MSENPEPTYAERFGLTQPRWQTCPVCFGKGIVPGGFYLTTGLYAPAVDTAPVKCRSCDGRGIVR